MKKKLLLYVCIIAPYVIASDNSKKPSQSPLHNSSIHAPRPQRQRQKPGPDYSKMQSQFNEIEKIKQSTMPKNKR